MASAEIILDGIHRIGIASEALTQNSHEVARFPQFQHRFQAHLPSTSPSTFLNVVCLLVSIFYFFKRKEPRTFIEWLNERAKPPLMFGKKED